MLYISLKHKNCLTRFVWKIYIYCLDIEFISCIAYKYLHKNQCKGTFRTFNKTWNEVLSKNSRRCVYVHENIISVNRFLRRLLLYSSLIHSFKIRQGFMHFLPQSSPFPSVKKIMYQIIVNMDFKEVEMSLNISTIYYHLLADLLKQCLKLATYFNQIISLQ